MGWFDEALGWLRSLALYELRSLAQRRLLHFYRGFLRPPGLAFDIGAHLGNHSRALLALGLRVVAVEPQPALARRLAALAAKKPQLVVLPLALADRPGRLTLALAPRAPTVATASCAFQLLMQEQGVRYRGTLEVEAVTLDQLIAGFGRPDFIKLDAEGMEPAILAGLSQAVPVLAFEHLPQRPEATLACLERLMTLGDFRFDCVIGERRRFVFGRPLTAAALQAALKHPPLATRAGDIYAFLTPSAADTMG